MTLITRIIFIISILTLGIFTFDIDFIFNNLALLYIFTIGFALSFVFAFLRRGDAGNKIVLWVSAIIIILFVAYRLLVTFLWNITI